MAENVSIVLERFTQRVVEQWRLETGHEPVSTELYGISSPCIVRNDDDKVFWLPQPFDPDEDSLVRVENAMDISIHPDVHQFYTYQYAGDMSAVFNDTEISLVQVWNHDDFIRLQENLIGHLFTQRRLKLSPTLFLATLDSELEMISVCNISGEVILEYFGSKKRDILAPSLSHFLNQLQIVINCK